MFLEYDVVRLRSATSAPSVPVGMRGTILIVHNATPPAYEVEFVDDEGETLGCFTMQESDLEFYWRQDQNPAASDERAPPQSGSTGNG